MGEEVQTVSSDIIIVGGGIAGATLACTLAQQTSLSITVLEEYADMAIWSADTYHHRVSAITLASQRIFQALNVWEAMQAKRVSPFTRIQVWDA
ncbi:MAG TPA: FAD-dependent oxidoreductase, partial [Gammaproteobacteria bacterium]|nr:FAD-dependent oxidoreductase [Gammaproteobacteria bacterium]